MPRRQLYRAREKWKRRRFLQGAGVLTAAGLAGCVGDDDDGEAPGDDDDDDDDDGAPPDNGDDDDPPDNGDDDDPPEHIVHDHTAAMTVGGAPPPPDTQYQAYNFTNRSGWWHQYIKDTLAERSIWDQQYYGTMGEWEYIPGTLTFELHDDFYYWTGENITAENIKLHYQLENWAVGGGEGAFWTHITDMVVEDEHTLRFDLADVWHEDYAISQTLDAFGWEPSGTNEYYMPYLERFQDAPDSDAVDDIATELLVEQTEDNPDHFEFNPFRIEDVEEDRWIFKLRNDEDVTPRFVEDINYEYFHLIPTDEEARQRQLFMDGVTFRDTPEHWDPGDLPFDVHSVEHVDRFRPTGILFNCSEPPGSNPHFRRAINYMTNRELFTQVRGTTNDLHTPFFEIRRDNHLGSDLLDSLETFGYNETLEQEATEEMERGGFERDDDGNWLHQEGDQAGEPIELTLWAEDFRSHVPDVTTDFESYMGDWGIQVETQLEDGLTHRLADADFTIAATDWGGGEPIDAFGVNFGDGTGAGLAGNTHIPETVEAPPVGDPWPDVDDGDLVNYDVESMTDRLTVLADPDEFQETVDELAWVFNQVTPRFGVEFVPNSTIFNADLYDVISPEESPDRWTWSVGRRAWYRGVLQYRADD